MDRQPLAPTPVEPFEPSPETGAAIAAFAAGLDSGDPMQIGFVMTPVAMVVVDPTLPDSPLIFVNRAFERLTGFPASEVLGRNCRFMQGPLTNPDDVARLKDAIARREPIELDLLNHRRDGTPFWNRLMVAPVFRDDGSLRYFVASQIDVTIERHRVHKLEQDREALADEVAQRDADLAAHNARLRLALKAGALGTWTLDLPEQVLTASSGCKRVFGRPLAAPFTYDDLLTAIHPDDLPAMQAAVRRTIEHGAPYEIEYRILTPGGEQRWVLVQGELQYRADGTPLSMAGFSTDISQRKFAEEHRAVLARELTHRVKNTLATVNAVVSQTLRDAASIEDAAATISGRIASLGAAQELLIQDEVEGAAIGDIVEKALLPFRDRDGARFAIDGPAVRLSPEITLALAMALHELATNAVKYGALSVPEGRVAIEWSIRRKEGGRRLFLCWGEHDGPPVTPPTRTGFGTRMIERVLRKHVRGGAAIQYLESGVRFEIEAPV
ncbi:PAS domain-containing protein [Sphingomonas sp. NBWT7]|uniref:PAS domain-containing protein n=1 Tax=Sphingomonas sp. NBWT7 TaxID=2596913 RepID=UPI001628C552|nr:PAS domain-containing protein [Sphingomonas sp. NBWT7]QNE32938.1 PAS domain-containing protein [Sphingomonas sp. NBWT7]